MVRIGFIQLERKYAIIAREKKYMTRHKSQSYQKFWKKIIKKTVIETVSLKVKIGLLLSPLTLTAIPLLSIFLEMIKTKKLRNYDYAVFPDFGDKPVLDIKIDSVFSIRIYNILYFYLLNLLQR